MIEIPTDLPLPPRCPECGKPWNGHGETAEGEVSLVCFSDDCTFTHTQMLSPEDRLRFDLAIDPEQLIEVPVFLDGEDEPFPRIRVNPLDHPLGDTRIRINRVQHRVVAVDSGRVTVRPIDSN